MSRRNGGADSGASTAAVFGEVLRHFREAALLTQEGLARQIPCDRSHVARVEGGTRVPQDTFAKTCDELLGTGGVLARLWARIDWYPQVEHPDWFRRRAEMDEVAVSLREYQERVMPGLLQTADYAQSLFSLLVSGEELEERVRARLSRQQRFLAEGGPLYIVVLDESCLRNMIGGPAVMRDQCAHLLNVGRRPNIRIQVAPASRLGLFRPSGSMSLIKLPDGHDWVYSESLDRGHFNDDPALFARHSHTYDVLRADALSAPQSADLIHETMERYAHHGRELADLDQEQLQRRQRRQLHRNSPRLPRNRPRPRQQEP
ncbi:helix-turn-helix domain-containing protein [Streptomyces collinus]|uniref:Transcriptional regulator with XRE-family HTH domain n=1 Tax=Streptomyces collinus TaxID=42684 RepID=A0AA89QBD9_STRCU|nr:helix-turn-helix transcriptional regulator [Streptomyces collinus]MBB5813005.1 transcriptional regulator with XRE-family HTH domain [Streptomyces collinus]WMX66129.1 helix-turn-helix transcriptional regulator [Streptomyces collinus]